MKQTFFATLALLASVAVAKAAGPIPHGDAAAVATGKAVYAEHCASCHGANLEGEPDWQFPKDNGLRAAPPHDATGHTWHHPDAQLIDITTHGLTAIMARRGMAYESEMTGYGEILSQSEILAVLAYIKSTWPARVIEMHDKINAQQ